MNKLAATLCLTVALVMGSVGAWGMENKIYSKSAWSLHGQYLSSIKYKKALGLSQNPPDEKVLKTLYSFSIIRMSGKISPGDDQNFVTLLKKTKTNFNIKIKTTCI